MSVKGRRFIIWVNWDYKNLLNRDDQSYIHHVMHELVKFIIKRESTCNITSYWRTTATKRNQGHNHSGPAPLIFSSYVGVSSWDRTEFYASCQLVNTILLFIVLRLVLKSFNNKHAQAELGELIDGVQL